MVQIGKVSNMQYGLLGRKLAHSYSKVIHESLMDYTYDMIEREPQQLDEFFEKREFNAINVTVPYKKDVIKYLDEIDERAKMIGAVNTIVNRDGKLYGYNTDFDGVIELLKYEDVSISDKNVLILGTGGTSNTVYSVCKYLGAGKITKVSRSIREYCVDYSTALTMNETQVIINTTPCGMYPDNDSCPIEIDGFDNLEAVVDVIYNPFKTKLIQKAKKRNLKGNGGFYMLVAQAVKAIEHFKSIELDEALIEKVYKQLYKAKLNVVLTGMPGCGKSTIGTILAQRLERPLVDTDYLIIEEAKCSITEIFEKEKESGFRARETESCKKAGKCAASVISTGGGAILRQENVDALKQNGIVFYLQRDVEKLQSGNGRPLSRTIEDNRKRFAERKEIYETTADYFIDNNGEIEAAVNRILEILNEDSSN